MCGRTLYASMGRARAAAPSRQAGDSAGDGLIVIEGERIFSRNDSGIRSAAAYITSLSPYDPSRRLQNHLSGDSFSWAGAVVTYRVEAEQAAQSWCRIKHVYHPDPVKAAYYERKYQAFRSVISAMDAVWPEIDALQA